MFDVIVVCGPTASGKSELAIRIANEFGGEIISADSMQIYREMNIGTAKPSVAERRNIPHYIIDNVSVEDEYNVTRFVAEAQAHIDDILSRGKLPVIVGGTGLYIDSLINNVKFSETDNCEHIRKQLFEEFNQYGAAYIYNKLAELDPKAAENIHINNVKRLIRALEINISTGKTVEQVNAESIREPKYKALFIGINFSDREKLYERINIRVDNMIKNGLLQEAEYIRGLELSDTARGAIGYKELFDYFENKCTLEDAVELLKQKTRNYAKRQITWFKRNESIHWFYPDLYTEYSLLVNEVIDLIRNSEV